MIKTKIIYGCEESPADRLPYMTRITFFEKPWGQLCLHIIHRSDWARDLHDHPWDFISLILWRGYREVTETSSKRTWPGMLLFRRAEHRHRVELPAGKTVISLVFMFKYKRMWGFWTEGKFMNWRNYEKAKGC
jgi:hypothetical protein